MCDPSAVLYRLSDGYLDWRPPNVDNAATGQDELAEPRTNKQSEYKEAEVVHGRNAT